MCFRYELQLCGCTVHAIKAVHRVGRAGSSHCQQHCRCKHGRDANGLAHAVAHARQPAEKVKQASVDLPCRGTGRGRVRHSKANVQRLSISIAAWVRKSITSSARCQASRRASKGTARSIGTKELWLDLLQASARSDSSMGRDGGRSIRLRCRESVCSLAAAADISQACAWIAARIRQLGPLRNSLKRLA